MGARLLRAASVIAVIVLGAGSAHAQVERSGGGEQQRIMQQYQQLASEKMTLQSQLAQMKKDLDAAQSELAATKKERDALRARTGNAAAAAAEVAQLNESKQTAEKNLEQYKQRMVELVTRFREMAANLRDTEADRTKLRQTLEERNKAFDRCAADNLSLYEINGEILDRYEHVGLFTKASTAEPFTRLTRARIENLVDEYRERALQLRAEKKTSP